MLFESIEQHEPRNIPKMNLPSPFVESYMRYQSYPLHVASKDSYGLVLPMYRDRLSKNAAKLCISSKDDSFVVPFREVVKNAHGQWAITKYNALDEERLKRKLGDTTRQDLMNPAKITGTFATQPDPRCRFMLVVVFPTQYLIIGSNYRWLQLSRLRKRISTARPHSRCAPPHFGISPSDARIYRFPARLRNKG